LEAPPEHRRQFGDGQQPVRLAGVDPLTAAQATRGHDEVHVGMMLQLAAPGVEHADEAEFRAEQPGLRRDLLQCGRTLAEEQVVQQPGLAGDHPPAAVPPATARSPENTPPAPAGPPVARSTRRWRPRRTADTPGDYNC